MKGRVWFCATIAAFAAVAVLTPVKANAEMQMMDRAAGTQTVEFEVFLRLQNRDKLDKLLKDLNDPHSAKYHQWLTPAEFHFWFSPSAQDLAVLAQTLKSSGLNVVGTNSHAVSVQSNARAVEQAFATTLWNAVMSNGQPKVVAAGPITLPPALQQMGALVVGLHGHELHTYARRVTTAISPDNRVSPYGGYWFDDLKQAYDFPSYQSLDGSGRTIAIMSASDYLDSDIAAYFGHESTTAAPIAVPNIIRFPLHGGSPFNPNSGDSAEAELDLQQAGGMAPGATLVLVNLPDATDGSFLDGYLTLVESNSVDIVSTSFGGPEGTYTAAYNGGVDQTGILQVFDDVFKQGNAQGITFVASSGDFGGLGLPPVSYFTAPPQTPPVVVGNMLPGVEFFASSPHVTAVGGTNLETTYDPPSLESNYVFENAYGDPLVPFDPYGTGNLVAGGYWGSGGGKSIFFAKPAYQYFIETGSTTRAVPDISLQMGGCPAEISVLPCHAGDSGTYAILGGQLVGLIGTSISAPDFAGILALKEQFLGGARLGNVNYEIYSIAAAQPNASGTSLDLLHQGQPGFNGEFYTTKTGYNFVLGVGTPLVQNFIFAPELPVAGDPQTPSNP